MYIGEVKCTHILNIENIRNREAFIVPYYNTLLFFSNQKLTN